MSFSHPQRRFDIRTYIAAFGVGTIGVSSVLTIPETYGPTTTFRFLVLSILHFHDNTGIWMVAPAYTLGIVPACNQILANNPNIGTDTTLYRNTPPLGPPPSGMPVMLLGGTVICANVTTAGVVNTGDPVVKVHITGRWAGT